MIIRVLMSFAYEFKAATSIPDSTLLSLRLKLLVQPVHQYNQPSAAVLRRRSWSCKTISYR